LLFRWYFPEVRKGIRGGGYRGGGKITCLSLARPDSDLEVQGNRGRIVSDCTASKIERFPGERKTPRPQWSWRSADVAVKERRDRAREPEISLRGWNGILFQKGF